MSIKTELLFLNHASVLIRYGNNYLMTDPWFQKPAFGSWLPVPPLAVHPVYLTSLGAQLRILISHGHDDHCDHDFIALFENDTQFLSADFVSPSVQRRLKQLGFLNYLKIPQTGADSGPFKIKSYINQGYSPDDAVYTIETPDALIVHANDNWVPLFEEAAEAIKRDISRVGGGRSLYMSQSNSASGFPLIYKDFSDGEKKKILLEKVTAMTLGGMRNAVHVGAHFFMGYAGYSGVFVKDYPEYTANSIFPSPSFLRCALGHSLPEGLEFLDIYPGDRFDFTRLEKAAVYAGITEDRLKKATLRYYEKFGVLSQCDSYLPEPRLVKEDLERRLRIFLQHFNDFAVSKSKESGYGESIIGKTLILEVRDPEIALSLEFGNGVVPAASRYNKKIMVKGSLLNQVLEGKAWFENLYTGYEAELSRQPRETYNRDIITYITMYSYVYKNRILPTLTDFSQKP